MKRAYRFFMVLAAALLCFAAMQSAVFADSSKYTEDDKNGGWYYRSVLSRGQQAYYDAVVEAATDPSPDKEVVYWNSECGYDDEMIDEHYYYYEHPELYWLRYNGTVNTYSRNVERGGKTITEKYITISQSSFSAHQTISMEQGIQEMEAIEQEVNAFMADIDLDQPEAAVALDIHDKLISEITYDNEAASRTDIEAIWDPAHTLYGAMVEKSAVCDGYAMAYTYLLRKAGIESIVVDGTMNTAYVPNVTHAWNMVKLGGEWYETDATHNDSPTTSLQHSSYNVTTETMSTLYDSGTDWSHSKNNFVLKEVLPTATSTHFAYDYMKSKGVMLSDNTSSTDEKLVLAIDNNGTLADLDTAGSGTAWKIRLCKKGSTLKAKKNYIYSIEKVTSSADLIDFDEVDKDSDGYFVRVSRNARTQGSTDIAVKVVFDNGSIAYVRGVLELDGVNILTLNKTQLDLVQDEYFVLEVTTESGEHVDVVWTSSDDAVAAVDSTGKVTAVSKGSTVITADVDGAQFTCQVKVKSVLYSGTLNNGQISWSIDSEGTLKVSGTGALPDFRFEDAPWYTYSSSIKKAVVTEGITTISAMAFSYMNYLTSVILPSTIETIEGYGLYNCSRLTSVEFTGATAPSMTTSSINYCRNAVITAPGNSTGYLDLIQSWEETGHSNRYKSFVLKLDDSCTEVSDIPDQNYTGSLIVPDVEVMYQGNILVNGTDYDVTATNDDEDGTVKVTCKGIYSGTVSKDFRIVKQNIAELSSNIVLTPSAFVYSGTDCIPAVTIVGVSSNDFDVRVMDNVNAGTGHVIITGKGRLTGSVTVPFTIEAKEIEAGMIALSNSDVCVGSTEQRPDVVVMDGQYLLVENTDYTLVNEGGTAIGDYPVTVTGEGNYRGTETIYLHIKDHDWDEGEITTAATCTTEGIKTFTCKNSSEHVRREQLEKLGHKLVLVPAKEATATEDGNIAYYECERCHKLFKDEAGTDSVKPEDTVVPKPEPDKPTDSDPDGQDTSRKNQKGKDGTAIGEGASLEAASSFLTKMKSDSDPKGAVFNRLQAKSTKQGKTQVTIKWKKVSGAAKYVIFGNKCGTTNRVKKFKTVKGTKLTVKKILTTKLKNGTYYKFIIVSINKNNDVVSTSKFIHVATKGGKVGNHKAVQTKAKKNKVTLKKGKSFKLAGKAIPKSSKLKVKKHVVVRYESTKPLIAKVSKEGVIKGLEKGTVYIYVYAQNGISKKIKVTVK